MARFVFRLQSVLGVKEKIEDQKKLEYGQALARLEEERRRKAQLEAELAAQILYFKESIHEQINPELFRGCNNYIQLLQKKIREQIETIQRAEAYAEKKRLELVEAMKERKMLDTLKEKAREEYVRTEQLAEQKIVDEIVSYQYNNQDNGGK